MPSQWKLLVTAIIIFGFSAKLFATGANYTPTAAQTSSANAEANQAAGNPGSTAAGTDVASAAGQNSSNSKMGAIVNGAVAGALGVKSYRDITACCDMTMPSACCVMGYLEGAMSVVAGYQSIADFKQSGTDAGIQSAASCSGSNCTTDAGTATDSSGYQNFGSGSTATNSSTAPSLSTDPLTLQAKQAAATAQAAISGAAANGITYNPATNSVATPSGSISGSQMSSAKGLQDAGFTSADATAAMNALAAAQAAASKKIASLKSEGLFNEYSSEALATATKSNSNYDFNANFLKMMNRKPAGKPTVAGLSKKIASGESIGVAGDNIFDMVKRQYQSQRRQGSFLDH